jgi:hypothetical protein
LPHRFHKVLALEMFEASLLKALAAKLSGLFARPARC